MFLVGWIAKALIARNLVSEKRAGLASWAITIVGAGLLAFGGWQLLKGSIIRQHDTEQRAKTAEQQLDRTNKADAVDDKLEASAAASDQAVKGAIDNAVAKDPKRGTSATGPVTGAAVDELRRQRRGGQRKQPPAH